MRTLIVFVPYIALSLVCLLVFSMIWCISIDNREPIKSTDTDPFSFIDEKMIRATVACWEKTLLDSDREDYGMLHNATYCLFDEAKDGFFLLDSIAWYNKTLQFRRMLSDPDTLWRVYTQRVEVFVDEVAARGLQKEVKTMIAALVPYFGRDFPELIEQLEMKYQAIYRCGSATWQANRGEIDSETPKLICGFVDSLNKDLATHYSPVEIDDQEWALRRKREGVSGTWSVILQDLYLRM